MSNQLIDEPIKYVQERLYSMDKMAGEIGEMYK